MDSPPLLIEDFGQKVDLTRRIREVLLNYPEGTTVLKEIIQNADDAGASSVRLCLDRRSHPSHSLLSPSLSHFQGPSLLAFNDAVFTDDDFISISRIGGSTKHSQASKTGRFGVGFNSVYHLTDLPSFVSGKYVVLFDPQGAYLPHVSSANPGKRIDFVSSSAISAYNDQFSPYCAFGCDMKTPFNGTLFRFPLRNAGQAAASKLSRQAYLEDDISSMFTQLYEEGVLTLLFLKCVSCIEMYIWDAGEFEPRKLYSCSVSLASGGTVWHRQAFLRLSKSVNLKEGEMDSFSLDFLSEASDGTLSERRADTFYIVQTMAPGSSRVGSFAATASKEYDIHLLPWASVAACVSPSSNSVLKLGGAFCFLPLPVRTGLPVQVNAYFEVSSNRRGIWYGDDMDRSGKIRSVWNRLLLEDVVAPAFVQMLLGVRQLLGPTESYYSLWPIGTFEEPWHLLVEHMYRNMANAPVLYSQVEQGRWVSPVEAFLHDAEFNKSKDLGDALVLLGMPVVCLSSLLFDMVLRYSSSSGTKVVTPATVRHYLRGCKTLSSLSRHPKLVLLEYCLEDLIDSDVGPHMYNLPLLPLANGGFGLFSDSSKRSPVYICNELEFMLLQGISDRVVDRSIPLHLLNRLAAIAESSETNLKVFTIHDLLQLFPSFVPADWKYKNRISWDPGHCHHHPSPSWFQLFWRYLKTHCEKLEFFCDWPILPSTSGHLYRASSQSRLIQVDSLTDEMQNILLKIGCKILNNNFGVEHQDLSQFLYPSDNAGILESIYDTISPNGGIDQTFQIVVAEERDKLRNFLLDFKWYLGEQAKEFPLQKCKMLPIYKVYSPGSQQNFQYSDLENPPKYLPPLDVPESLLGVEFIIISTDVEEDILSRYFGIKRMGKVRFYREQVFCRLTDLQPELRDSIMLSVLKNLPQLCHEEPLFRDCLRNLEFVPTLSGVVKCPSALYDPRVEELFALLENSDCFPHGSFQDAEVLDMLQGLGLRTSVCPETVLESARQVEQLMHKDNQKAYSRGKVLLSFLEVNALKWLPDKLEDEQSKVNRLFSLATTAFRPRNLKSDLEKFWSDLRMISWCPVLSAPPFQALPWPAASSAVAPPKHVRLERDLWLVSASFRILDGECSSTALSYGLGWSSPPGGAVIAAQLLELGKNNEVLTDSVLRRELALVMPRIYSILTGLLGSDEMDIVKAVLEGSRWIWVGDGFATSDEVVLDGPLHLAPYIRVIPIDLAVFRGLFLELGVREFLKPADYVDILGRMAMTKGSSPLDSQEMRAAILIVQHLSEVQVRDQQVKIYLPDVSGRLFPASDLVYNDAPWLLSSEDSDGSLGGGSKISLNAKRTPQKFVHGNISNDVADRLGVCSLRRILLAENADSMNLSLSGAAEAFGQHEALTTRLRHILEMYADGPGTLYELVQNAEDAGASEVIFLLDKTQYGTSSVLSPEMVDWQGPALYCFNDSVFSPQDLYAISRIGQESKLEKPFAIGRFGLGFNCVYHFTDIPSFVSGENIVMFDPHACHLPGISPSHPGLRIRFAGRNMLEQFPDQFSPFLRFGCDMLHPFPGTLFRFPLRSATVASRSQIKKESYAPEDVISLFASFSDSLSDSLLFLRNVKTITIFVKEGTGQQMQLLHRVQKNSVAEHHVNSQTLHHVFGFIDGDSRSGMDRDRFLKKLSDFVDKDLPYRCQKVVVSEEGSSDALLHFWITSECLGSGQLNNHFGSSSEKSNKFVPCSCIAAHLYSGTVENEMSDTGKLFQSALGSLKDTKDFEGRAFCFLPLPISTGLPVHVNAYFELSSNRRDIWFGNDMAGHGKRRSDWNIYLLEDVAAPAYGHLLEKLAVEIGPCDLYFSFWPTNVISEPWASMVRKLYSLIADFGVRVLYTKARGGQWISAKQAIFPDYNFPKSCELGEALSAAGLPLVTASKPLVGKFLESCSSLHFLSPQYLRNLLIRRCWNFMDRAGLILALEYCLFDLGAAIKSSSLHGLPLLPLADGSFTAFDKNGVGERIYIAQEDDEYSLLKDLIPKQLVDGGIPREVHLKLCVVAQTGDSNLSFLSCDLLEKLFFKVLPAEWRYSKQVTWSPGHEGHPSVEWLLLFWNYLKSSCHDLNVFSKWPVLPVGDSFLYMLVENSDVIRNDGWSENMCSLLQKVGCQFLRSDMPIEHPQLEKFVHPPTAAGILNALLSIAGKPERAVGLFGNASEGELHELKNFLLQSKWFSEDQLDERQISLIKYLPVFESYRSRKLVSLYGPVKWLKPDGVREDLLNDDFVRTETEKERDILKRFLGIGEPSKLEFYKDYVLNHMPDFLLQPGAISVILQDIKLLAAEDASVRCTFSVLPFVLAADGFWQPPSRLYDPRVPELKKILHAEAFFPAEEFSDPDNLETLSCIGLRRKLGFVGLLDCARAVAMLHDSGDSEAVKCGQNLLSLLDDVALQLSGEREEGKGNLLLNNIVTPDDTATDVEAYVDSPPKHDNLSLHNIENDSIYGIPADDKPEEEFWYEIRAIAWCPIWVNPPFEGIPWLKSATQVASPDAVRPKSQMWIVSSRMHILDGDCRSSYLLDKLGWMNTPGLEVLASQLIELSKLYGQLRSQSLEDPVFDDALQKGILSLYSKLQVYVGTGDLVVLKSMLDGVSCVWTGDDFVPVHALAFDSPVKFHPYLDAVPSELVEFEDLLLELGVRPSFDVWDYLRVLQHLQNDVRGSPLSMDQLNFVVRILEAVADYYSERSFSEASNAQVLAPDSSGILVCARDLVFNDAPWMETATVEKRFVHLSISNDLASKLGIQSVRSVSLVDEEMTKDLPCMDFSKIKELLAMFGSTEFLLFDLLELADCCKAKKFHVIVDKREHRHQSLLQQNLAEFQGPALVVILEGVTLSREEVSSLQLRPPWRMRGDTLNYGLGLLSCYALCDLLSIVSGGYFYMFDPRGVALAIPSSCAPAAKMFPLIGTNLTTRFRDQFSPLLIGQDMLWSSAASTLIRMPLSLECGKEGLESGMTRIKTFTDVLSEHASRALLFLKSVLQVSISTWDEGNLQPLEEYSVSIDYSVALARNPFSEKKWRKFQISRLFSSSNATTKVQMIDVNVHQGGNRGIERWLVVLSLGSGQTRNMALDRRYLAYTLTPVSGIAAQISRDGHPLECFPGNSILSPLPLSSSVNLPVTIFGCFLVCHNRGRYLFKHQDREASVEAWDDAGNQLIEAWNRELMSGVLDSYIEMVMEIQKLRREPSTSTLELIAVQALNSSLKIYGDGLYCFWPRSTLITQPSNDNPEEVFKADWKCLVERVIRPFYSRAVDLPVWQLYSGNLVKASEGMFLSQPGNAVAGNLLPSTVCDFVKEQYPVFSVPWELVSEIQAVGITVQEIKPKMVRDLLKDHSTSFVLRSVSTYLDVLEYCLSDIRVSESIDANRPDTSIHIGQGSSSHNAASSGDALEMVTTLGRAIFDFGRGVVEDIGRPGEMSVLRNSNATNNSGNRMGVDQRLLSLAAMLKGLPFPTATKHLTRLGLTELWLGSREQQKLMIPLAAKFIHSEALDRTLLIEVLSNPPLQSLLRLQKLSLPLLSSHMKYLFHDNWVGHVMGTNLAPWFSWESSSVSVSQVGPTPEWIRLFWKNFSGCGSLSDLTLFSDWPLIPAFLGRPILCRVKERCLIFVPPLVTDQSTMGIDVNDYQNESSVGHPSESSTIQSYLAAFEAVRQTYPWLPSLLNQCNIPIFDGHFMECAASCGCLPAPGQSLGQVIASKLVAARKAGYFPQLTSVSASDKDELVRLFANDFSCNDSNYGSEELEVLQSLPIYKTVIGSYTRLHNQGQCLISPNSFLKPYDDHCLSYTLASVEGKLVQALGIPEWPDQQILVRFGLPGYDGKTQSEQEDILIYLFMNWQDLQSDSSLVEALKETKFVKSADEFCTDLYKPKDLFDPSDALLTSVFSGERRKFPGERFTADGWLRILRKTGLRSASEADVIVECARRVEFLGADCIKSTGDLDDFAMDSTNPQNEIPMEVYSLAGSVVDAIFSNFAVLYGNNFCNTLGKIACIPAELGFPSIGGKKGGRRVFTSYNDAILLKDWPLAWSCAPILSRQNVIPPEYSWGSLHLRSPPAFPKVLKHLQVIGKNGGEDTLAHWPIASGMMTVDDASLEILKYLDKVWGTLSSADVMELQKVAFILAANGTRLVTANSLFARLPINLSPFAFELPGQYLPYVKLLKDLGLQDMLSIDSAKCLLLDLQRACGYQRLNPNELRAVVEILHYLCDEIVEGKVAGLVNWESAIIPDDGCRLVHAQTCVFVDSYGSQFVKYIDISRLRFVHPNLPDSICEALGIKKLSDVVIEELSDKDLQTLGQIGAVPLSAIRERMLSGSLQVAVWTVVKSMSRYTPSIGHLSLESVQNSLQLIGERLQFIKCISTRFRHLLSNMDITRAAKSSNILEWEEDSSQHRTLYFVNRSKDCILVAEPPTYVSILDVISTVVSQVLGSPIPLPIASLFISPEGSESALIDAMGLCSDKRELEQRRGSSGLVGEEILAQDALQVQFHPLRPFYRGEIVAWRLQNGEKLRYGRVPEDVSPSAGQALYRFKVETAPGVTAALLSSQVLSFKSVSVGSFSGPSTSSSESATESRKHVEALHGRGGLTNSSQAQQGQYGRVTAGELVQAVHELLSAAGVHVDVEKQSLLQNAISLQEVLEESRAALLHEQERAEAAAKEADAARAAWICRVCLTGEVDMAMVPCGHVLCRRCSSAVSRCPFCRVQVTKSMRIFRP
ncbi:sacsin isoform X1 [Punica granatum]|uniref:Sacsin isoform X1 n=2 Tax=Punica granatum TaxID=22663 RepID=A0A6P8BP55_PUNGR|nr:sacsin isoform X1 [Punica granatum]